MIIANGNSDKIKVQPVGGARPGWGCRWRSWPSWSQGCRWPEPAFPCPWSPAPAPSCTLSEKVKGETVIVRGRKKKFPDIKECIECDGGEGSRSWRNVIERRLEEISLLATWRAEVDQLEVKVKCILVIPCFLHFFLFTKKHFRWINLTCIPKVHLLSSQRIAKWSLSGRIKFWFYAFCFPGFKPVCGSSMEEDSGHKKTKLQTLNRFSWSLLVNLVGYTHFQEFPLNFGFIIHPVYMPISTSLALSLFHQYFP